MLIKNYLNELKVNLDTLEEQEVLIDLMLKIVTMNKKKIFICGNGGSSATASHMVNDFQKIGKLDACCLTDNTPLLTAWANDDKYENVFENQLKCLAREFDVLIVISGSGTSPNIVKAVEWAKEKKMYVFGLVGTDGGKVKKLVKTCIHIPTDMLHFEDISLVINHIIAKKLKEKII